MKVKSLNHLSVLIFGVVFFCSAPHLNAQTWLERGSNFSESNKFASLISIVDDNVVWAFSDPNLFTISTDGGTTFNSITGNLPFGLEISSISAVSATTAYVVGWSGSSTTGVYFTMDGGTTWTKQPTASFSDPVSFPNCIHFFDLNNGVCTGNPANGYFEVYTTSDGGTNWTRIPSIAIPLPETGDAGEANSFDAIGNSVWFGTSHGFIYRSNDKGLTWQATKIPDTKLIAPIFTFSDEKKGIVSYTRLSTNKLALGSTNDGGATFTAIAFSGLTTVSDIEYVPGTSQVLAKYGNNSTFGDYFSGDNGFNWLPMFTPKYISNIEFLNSSTGFASTANATPTQEGIYKFVNTISIIGSAIEGPSWLNDLVLQTTDGVNYTATNVYMVKYTPSNDLKFKFRQNKSWGYNWGTEQTNNQFPSGTGVPWIAGTTTPQSVVDIKTNDYGYYNVSLNRITGVYNFQLVDQPTIGFLGFNSISGIIHMTTDDGFNFSLLNQTINAGPAKFVEENNPLPNNIWGGTTFPLGIAIIGGSNISVSAGNYNLTFNRLTYAYNFESVLGIKNNPIESIEVYPNPTKDILNINSTADIKTIHVYNSIGQIVRSKDLINTITTIDFSALQNGIYLVKMNSDNASKTVKVFKQ